MQMMSAFIAAKSFFLLITRPKDRPQNGSNFLKATEGSSNLRSFERFRAHPDGQRLLERQPDSRAALRDKAALQAHGPGSFGQIYAEHMRAAALDEEYYVAAAVANADGLDRELSWYRLHAGIMHDINHVLTGYGATPLGEACLFSFRFAQLRHYGLPPLVMLAVVYSAMSGQFRAVRALFEAYRRGKAAQMLELMPWEDNMATPLAEVRARLNLQRPRYYECDIAPDAYLPG